LHLTVVDVVGKIDHPSLVVTPPRGTSREITSPANRMSARPATALGSSLVLGMIEYSSFTIYNLQYNKDYIYSTDSNPISTCTTKTTKHMQIAPQVVKFGRPYTQWLCSFTYKMAVNLVWSLLFII